jgi:Txe/YoeB family toxin of Txe-Axe toxin-antitoxin module
MSADRRPKRSKINVLFSQVVAPVAKRSKTDTCSRSLPPKIRSLYKNQANFCYDVVPTADPAKRSKTGTCSRRLPPKIRLLYNEANFCYDVVPTADPDLRGRLWCYGCQKYMDLPQHKRDKKPRSSYKEKIEYVTKLKCILSSNVNLKNRNRVKLGCFDTS